MARHILQWQHRWAATLVLGLLLLFSHAVPDRDCPEFLHRRYDLCTRGCTSGSKHLDHTPIYIHDHPSSGNANDYAVLSHEVGEPPKPLQLVCGLYTPVETVDGKLDTRMRIYRQERTGDTVVVFRFTVQPAGEVIHINR